MSTTHVICRADELPPGAKKIVQIGKKSIGVFNIKGEYFAILNFCPHQHAPLCLGPVTGYAPPSDTVGEYTWSRDGEIIRCPWHGWEFDIKNGKSIFNPHRVKTASYPAALEKSAPCGGHACDSNGNGGTSGTATPEGTAQDEDPAVETFPVGVED
jgi:nitrite reductase (NADH) small subunit